MLALLRIVIAIGLLVGLSALAWWIADSEPTEAAARWALLFCLVTVLTSLAVLDLKALLKSELKRYSLAQTQMFAWFVLLAGSGARTGCSRARPHW